MSGDFRIGQINQLMGPGPSYGDPASLGSGCRPLVPLSEADVRRIAREEFEKLLAEREAVNGTEATK